MLVIGRKIQKRQAMKKIMIWLSAVLLAGWVQAEWVQLGGLLGADPALDETDFIIQFNGAYTNLNTGAVDSTSGAVGEFSAVPSSLDLSTLSLTNGSGTVVTLADAGVDPVTYNASLQMRPGTNASFSFSTSVKLMKAGFAGGLPTDVAWGTSTDTVSGNAYDFQGSELAAGLTVSFDGPSDMRLLYLVFETSESLTPPPVSTNLNILVLDRVGTNVTGQGLVDSDHIHIEVSSQTNMISYNYQLILQAAEPTSGDWAVVAQKPFYKDIWFYREPTNQWVRILAEDADGGMFDDVIGLQSGILTAPPDDPIDPYDYVNQMRNGFIESPASFSEVDIVAAKKAGFGHFRLHFSGGTIQDLEDRVGEIMRHGMYTHPALGSTPDLPRWTLAAEALQFYSHRLAFEPVLEAGFSPELDAYYDDFTQVARSFPGNANRLLIYHSQNPAELDEITAPYADQNPADGVETGTGYYYFYGSHTAMLGTKVVFNDVELKTLETLLDGFIAPMNQLDRPVIIDAFKIYDFRYHNGMYAAAIRGYGYLEEYFASHVPYTVNQTFLTLGAYREFGGDWYDRLLGVVAAGGRGGIVRDNDPDGDSISTEDEINIYGTNPYDIDSDWDNIIDTYECGLVPGLDPNDPLDGYPTSAKGSLTNFTDGSVNADFDGDGMGNAWELLCASRANDENYTDQVRFDIHDPSDADLDIDSDKLTALWECLLWKTECTGPHTDRDPNDIPLEGDQDWDHIIDSNIDEILAGTWPEDMADTDGDGIFSPLRGTNPEWDLVPFVSDREFAVRLVFNESITGATVLNTASMGSIDYLTTPLPNATLMGDVEGYADQALSCLAGNGFVDVPKDDLGATLHRSVSLHFLPTHFGDSADPYQILFKEGGATDGRAIYLNEDKVWLGVWATSNSTLYEAHLDLHAPSAVAPSGVPALELNEWVAVTLVSDGPNQMLRGYLFKDNVRLNRAEVTTPGFEAVNGTSERTTLCGSDDACRFWDARAGASVVKTDQYFKGYLDDTLIYSRVLNDVEATWLSRTDIGPFKAVAVPSSLAAQDDFLHAMPHQPTTLNVLKNDTDVTGLGLSVDTYTQPSHGSLLLNGGNLIYQPTAYFAGTDSFTYTVTDGTYISDPATVTLEVYTEHFRVQRGTATIKPGWDSTTLVAGEDYNLEDSSSTSNAYIRLVSSTLNGGGNTDAELNLNAGVQSAYIADPENLENSITFTRFGRPVNTRKGPSVDYEKDHQVGWEILEYIGPAGGPNEIVVRSQSFTTNPIAPSVSSIQDPNQTVVFITGQSADGQRTDGLNTAELSAANEPIFTQGNGGTSVVSYAVVEFTGSNWAPVRRVEQSFSSSSTVVASINPPLNDVSQTFLHVQQRGSSSSESRLTGNVWIRALDELSFKMSSTAANVAVVWVVENTDTNSAAPMGVQQHANQIRIGDGSAFAPDEWTQSISPVPAPQMVSIMGECAQTLGNDTTGQILFNVTQTNEVALWNVAPQNNLIYSFSVVEWPRTLNLDADADGLPNEWESSHGLNLGGDDSLSDLDGDGFTALEEFYAGTDPDDSASSLKILGIQPIGSDIQLAWLGGVDGSPNPFEIYCRTNLVSGSWFLISDYKKTNQNGTNVWVDAGRPDSWGSAFYKITVPSNR